MADRDLDEAYAFLLQLKTARPNSFYSGALLEVARRDPQAMLVESEKAGSKRSASRQAAANAMAEIDPRSAIEWLAQQEDGAQLARYATAKLEPEHWELALDLFSGQRGLWVYGWASEHPLELLEVAMTELGARFLTDGMGQHAASRVAGQRPEAFEAWRKAHGDDPAAAMFLVAFDQRKAQGLARSRPMTAAEFVDAESDAYTPHFYALSESERGAVAAAAAELPTEAASQLVMSLTNREQKLRPEERGVIFVALSRENPGTRAEVQEYFQQLAVEWGRFMSQDAFAWASELEDGDIRDSTMKTVVDQWRAFDPEAAAVAAPGPRAFSVARPPQAMA
ncbi:MAG: hypothetical protein ACI9UA_000208 [Pseudoalteromonas tetraodonis]